MDAAMMGMEAKVLYLNAGRAASLCFDACKVPPTETLTNESMQCLYKCKDRYQDTHDIVQETFWQVMMEDGEKVGRAIVANSAKNA